MEAIVLNTKKKLTLITGITALSAVSLHLINKTVFCLSTSKELLFNANSHYYNWRFGPIFYTKSGSGSPVLLVHDITAASSHYEWKALVNNLSKKHTVYTIDLLGCGKSAKPKITYTNYLYVQLLTDFINNVIQEKTDIIASGYSDSTAVMTCFMEPDLIDRMILINPVNLRLLNKVPKKNHKLLKCLIDTPLIGTTLYNMLFSKNNIKRTFSEDYIDDSKRIFKKDISAFSEAAHLSGPASRYTYSSIRCHYINTNITHALKEINNSIYIIAGGNIANIDTILEEYKSINPSIETVLIPGTKGLPQIEKPSELLNNIDLYLYNN